MSIYPNGKMEKAKQIAKGAKETIISQYHNVSDPLKFSKGSMKRLANEVTKLQWRFNSGEIIPKQQVDYILDQYKKIWYDAKGAAAVTPIAKGKVNRFADEIESLVMHIEGDLNDKDKFILIENSYKLVENAKI